ncbi:MAG: hypothetical protein U9M95_04845 [Candidatus Altiarchaeota archaeon]|nr:hypothetical protein [Candidatus Altiarchaeota archaeon]
MKKHAILLLLIILTSTTLAEDDDSLIYMNWDLECNQNCCIVGEKFYATVQIISLDRIEVGKIKFITKAGAEFIEWGEDYDFRYDDGYLVTGDDDAKITVNGEIPYHTSKYLTYRVCIYYHTEDEEKKYLYEACSDYESLEQPYYARKREFSCDSDEDCEADEYCNVTGCYSECRKIKAENGCGYVEDHRWYDYECCENKDCDEGKACVENSCTTIECECGYLDGRECIPYECCSDLDCGGNGFCSEHKCISYDCTDDADCKDTEACVDHECVEIDCGICEFASNHTCIRYTCCNNSECSETQECLEHECVPLKCSPGFYAKQHECIEYDCMGDVECGPNESCVSNECILLECDLNKMIRDHACVESSNFPISSPVILVAAFIAVASLVYIALRVL